MSRLALGAAAAIVAAEGLAMGTFGVLEFSTAATTRRELGIAVGAMMLGYAALLLVVAYGLRRRRAWSRGPAVATQLLQLPIAWSFVGAGTTWVAAALALAALTVLSCVLLPSSTAMLVRTTDASVSREEADERLSGHD